MTLRLVIRILFFICLTLMLVLPAEAIDNQLSILYDHSVWMGQNYSWHGYGKSTGDYYPGNITWDEIGCSGISCPLGYTPPGQFPIYYAVQKGKWILDNGTVWTWQLGTFNNPYQWGITVSHTPKIKEFFITGDFYLNSQYIDRWNLDCWWYRDHGFKCILPLST